MSFSKLLESIPSLKKKKYNIETTVDAIQVLLACSEWAQQNGILSLEEASIVFDAKVRILEVSKTNNEKPNEESKEE